MKIVERIFDKLVGGNYTRLLEAASKAALIGTDQGDESKYRRLSAMDRDLSPIKFDKARKMSLYLWQRNPLCQRMIEIVTDFCLGDEFRVSLKVKTMNGEELEEDEVKSKKLQERWDLFCTDEVNQFYNRLEDYVVELKLTGELLLPVAPNPYNGIPRLGYIDTMLIEEVTLDDTGFRVQKVKHKKADVSLASETLNVVRYDPVAAKFIGEAFFFQQNRLLNQLRGYPDIMNLVDWLDGFDQFLFNSLEHAALVGAFFYDCKVIGASGEDLKKLGANLAPPKKGSVKMHNEKTEWDVISPELKALDTAELTRMFKNFILAAKGYPEHWFADGGNANRATAAEMDTPVMRMLKKEQKKIRDFIEPIARYVAFSANEKTNIFNTERDVVEIEINMFDFERKDAAIIGAGFVQIVSALTIATDKGWIAEDKAKEICDGFLGRLGVRPDFDMKVEDIIADKRERDDEDVYLRSPRFKKADEFNQAV